MLKRFLLVASLFLAASVPAFAQELNFIGTESKAMGGSGVARVDDATATYWNPARLMAEEGLDLRVTLGTDIGVAGDVISDADRLQDTLENINFDTLQTSIDNGTPLTNQEVQDLLDLALTGIPSLSEDGEGIISHADGGLFVRSSLPGGAAIGFHVAMNTYAGAETVFDFTNISFSNDVDANTQVDNLVGAGNDRTGQFTNGASQALADDIATIFTNNGVASAQDRAEELVFQAEQAGVDTGSAQVQNLFTQIATSVSTAGAGTISDNNSGVLVRGIVMTEVGVSYAQQLFNEHLNVGGTFRIIQGETFAQFVALSDLEDGEEYLDEIKDRKNTKKEIGIAVDVGATFSLNDMWTVGGVIKNLGAPSFGYEDPGPTFPAGRDLEDFELDTLMRVGAAFTPNDFFGLSFDMDLNAVDSGVLDGYETQYVGGGVRISPGAILTLRGGVYQNVADSTSNPVFTGGIRLELLALEIDITGGISPEEETVTVGADEEEIFTNISFAFSVGLRF